MYVSEEDLRSKQADLRTAKEAIAGPVPLITDAPDQSLVLPRGLFHSGVWNRDVVVRELTGVDEEALAKTREPVAFFSNVLAMGTTTVGSVDFTKLSLAERSVLLNELLIGEREQLFLKVIQTTFGNERDITFNCTVCGDSQEVTLLLSEDFKPAVVDDLSPFTYTTAKGDVLDVRPAVGTDQEEALAKKSASPAEQNTVMLARCITKCNGQMILNPLDFA